jgi:hypothetical protein
VTACSVAAPFLDRRLAISLGLALVLHAALLWAVRMPSTATSLPARLMSLELIGPIRFQQPIVDSVPDAPDVTATKREGGRTTAEAAAPAGASLLPSDSQRLMESARGIARSFALESGRSSAPASERSMLPQLDRALRLEAEGERRVAANVLRISDGKGHAYCIQEPPDWARDGPIPRHAAQVSCP